MGTRPLSRDRILKAAFTLADRGGLDAVTMRGVAGKLGVEAMSLYHHVPNKQAMLDGLIDLLIRVADLPTGDVDAEEWVRGSARGLRALAQQHPRVVPILAAKAVPLNDPESALPFEAGLAAFRRAGYSGRDAFAAVQAVAVALLAMAQLEATSTLDSVDAEATRLEELPADEFPLLHAVLEDPADLDDFWSVLVDGLVRGLAARP